MLVTRYTANQYLFKHITPFKTLFELYQLKLIITLQLTRCLLIDKDG